MESVISVKNLTQRYGRGRIIYRDLSFEVPKGSILGLLGKNGTGKTTTINILMGFLKPQSGRCAIFGEDITTMTAATRARIALLLEGHVQYSFMTISQIEKFYSRFYPRWNPAAYYELMAKLKVSPGQKISSMSNGQRSQVALGLILAQNADLLVLDDFSLGLDPGYRRLFVDYLRDYVKSENKTVFMTSHIIQDLERLVDDCIILDYGRILSHRSVDSLMKSLRRFTYTPADASEKLPENVEGIYSPWQNRDNREFYAFLDDNDALKLLRDNGMNPVGLKSEAVPSLEDAFIGLTGKY